MRGTARQICDAVGPCPSWSRPARSPRRDPRPPDLSPAALSPPARPFLFTHRAAPGPRSLQSAPCYTNGRHCTGNAPCPFTAAVGNYAVRRRIGEDRNPPSTTAENYGSLRRALPALHLCPSVAESDRAVEDKLARCRARVRAEIALPLELHRYATIGFRQ